MAFQTLIISEARANEPVAKKPSFFEQLVPFIFIIAIIYFLFIRPHQRNQKKQMEFTQTLKVGDEVLTSSGILGKIHGLTEKYVILEVSEQTKIRVLRSHIASYAQTSAVAKKQGS